MAAKKDIFIRLEEEYVTLVDELAAKLGLSRSATSALLIKSAIKHIKSVNDVLRDDQS